MKRPSFPRTRRGRIGLTIIGVAIAVVVGGPFVYAWITDSPAPFSSRRFGDPTSILADELEGRWRVDTGSQVGYRVEEQIGITDVTAVGRTDDVRGSFDVVDGVLTVAEFEVDLTTVTSDRSQRDDQFRGRIMEVATWPTARFELTEAATLPERTDPASAGRFTVRGELSLRGTTREVSVDLLAEIVDDRLRIAGDLEIVFSEWGIPNPSLPAALIFTANSGLLEFDLRAVPD
jgi:polyisoprenoid-binding protein YceI